MKKYTIKQTLCEKRGLEYLQKILASGRFPTRIAIVRDVCGHFQLFDHRGKPQIAQCSKVLNELDAKGLLKLPSATRSAKNRLAMRRLGEPVEEPVGVPRRVDRIKHLEFVEVRGENEALMRIWNELMIREHPLGKRKLVGRQIRYLIRSEHGWLGGFGFGAASLKLEARDKWIGWDSDVRQEHLDKVVGLSRFLIRGCVRCENLASRCLSMAVKRVGSDFENRYGYRPCLVESFVDTSRYSGTCFLAANWEHVGRTKGRGRNDRHTLREESVKDIYVYPLESGFRERFGLDKNSGGVPGPLSIDEGLSDDEWAAQEFGRVELGDKRLQDRLVKIAGDQMRCVGKSYLEAAGGGRAAVKGYYNFVCSEREKINFENILSCHREQTIRRMMGSKTVCVVQDTTDLNFSGLEGTSGLGVIGVNQTNTKARGMKLHSSIAVDTEDGGIPLGILNAKCWSPELKDRSRNRNSLPIEEKESYRWLEQYRDTAQISRRLKGGRLISVMDREGDIWELFQEAYAHKNRVPLVVRSQHNRCLADDEDKLFQKLEKSKNVFKGGIQVPRQRGRKGKNGKENIPNMPARTAEVTVSYEKVSLKAPATALKKDQAPLQVWAVYVREERPPSGAKAIEWRLLTTLEVDVQAHALEVIGYYRCRWRIEEWHRVIKSGCKTEDHANTTAERLKIVVALDMVMAWRIMLLTLLGRECPELPGSVFFSEMEQEALILFGCKKNSAR